MPPLISCWEKLTQLIKKKKKDTDSTPAKKHHQSHQSQNHMMKTQSSHSHDEDAIKSLTAKTNKLEKLVLELEGVLEVTRNGKTLLKQEFDILQEYQYHTSIIADGIALTKDET